MKTLYIVRHAKSNLKEPGLTDIERPLLERGKKRTKRIIDYLIDKNVDPDLIITSSAKRAVETAKYIAIGLSYPENKVKTLAYYYKIDADGIINDFLDFPDHYQSVMIVGHNPALTNFVNRFMTINIDSLPTSGVVCLKFEMDSWDEIENAKCHTDFMIYPSQLRSS